MLVRFTVGNFLSFNKNQTLSLIAGSVQRYKERLYQAEDMRLLKFGALYGANAAGKSNFIRAMKYVSAVLFLGTEKVPNDLYFKLDPSNKEKNSYFEFEICIDGKIYAYGFEMLIASRQITEEWLIELGKDRNRELFTRNTVTKQIIFDNSLINMNSAERMNVYLTDYKAVQSGLFLANIVTNKEDLYTENPEIQIFRKIYKWFASLNISFPETTITGYDCLSKEKSSELLGALKSFATGISRVVQTEITKEQALDKTSGKVRAEIEEDLQRHCPSDCEKVSSESECKNCGFKMTLNGQLIFVTYKDRKPVFTEVTFEHNSIPGITFSLAEESDGTQRLLDLLSVILSMNKNSVFVIDEIDRSLHPQLTIHFIKTFLRIAEKRNIQLIISTHESHLLDLDILRQDEIFFIEKGGMGESVLYPFDRFKERFDKKIEKPYLDGRYGGVPLFDTFFPSDDIPAGGDTTETE
jgi:uncharacterized protein